MTNVESLFREFIAADRAGGQVPDPTAFLTRVTGVDRGELAVLIDGYLERAPRRSFDAEVFAASPARRVAADLLTSLAGDAGTWPVLLPRLRHRAQLSRSQLVSRLAEALGAGASEDKVRDYYHAMEHGTLPAAGVTDRVLEALGSIIGETVEALRGAGEALSPSRGAPGTDMAFARVAVPDDEIVAAMEPPLPPAAAAAPHDEVDELFTGRSGTS